MRTLHYYILRELALPVLLSVCFFTLVLLLVQLLDLANTFLKAGVSGALLGHLTLIVLGTLLTFTVPMGVLLGTLIGIGRLATENEIIAIRVAGISPLRAFLPVLIAGLIISGAHMSVNNAWIPSLFHQIRAITYEMQFYVLTNLRAGRVYDELGTPEAALALTYERRGRLAKPNPAVLQLPMEYVNVRMRVRRTEILPEDAPNPDIPRANNFEFLLFAPRGLITGDPASGELTLDLHDGTWIPLPHTETGTRRDSTTVVRFQRIHNRIGSKRIDTAAREQPREMLLSDLMDRMAAPPAVPVWKEDRKGRRIEKEWKTYFAARNELISRFTLPFATFSFVLIAVPLAMEVRPRAKAFSTLITIVLLLVYYMLMTFANAVGSNGASWPAAIGAHLLPNALVGIAGAAMLFRISRQ